MALVDEYVESASPVGSSRIAQHYLKEVSPATVRNELMGLESEGYAQSPHTSAGRVPTNTGYRVFVNSLLLGGMLAGEQESFAPLRARLGGDAVYSLDRERRIDTALSMLTETTGLFSVVFSIRPDVAVYHRGMPQLLSQPEFHDATALVPLMQLIEDNTALAGFLQTSIGTKSFRVKVGIEDEDRHLSSYSMVAESFEGEQHRGVLAVFGPTRMDYRKVIPAVLYVSRLLGNARIRNFGW
jgi:transcriptional regulator of heat shock response